METSRDPESGLPVVSLYGDKTQPSREDLQDLDALVFDLQDAGVRFCTYSSTMLLCLDAAARAGIPFYVLDRPNPLGGERVAGPRRDPEDVVPTSLLSMAPGTLVHGLTLGEMARYANARRSRPADLTVVPMKGWKRRMRGADTVRAFVPPSPNLRSRDALLAYPGTCLLEATNVSEGRGTSAPFLLLGAPWLDAESLARSVAAPGFVLEPTRFTPTSSPPAPEPKYKDQECAGVRVHVTDPERADGYALGIALLEALRQDSRFEIDRPRLTRLLGMRSLPTASDDTDLDAWRRERKPFLLYGD